MRKLTRTQKTVAALAIGALGVAGSGVAWAYWTTSGSGEGTGTTGDATAVDNVTLVGTVTGEMVPGSGDHEVELTVSNPNSYSVSLAGQSLTLTGAMCGTTEVTWFSLTDAVIDSTTVVGAATTDVALADEDVAISFANSDLDDQDVCQDAEVSFTFTVA